MKVEVLLFAAARQAAGREKLAVELPSGSCVGELRRAIAAACPELAVLLACSLLTIDHAYVRDNAVVPPSAEIALIPPVSGG